MQANKAEESHKHMQELFRFMSLPTKQQFQQHKINIAAKAKPENIEFKQWIMDSILENNEIKQLGF